VPPNQDTWQEVSITAEARQRCLNLAAAIKNDYQSQTFDGLQYELLVLNSGKNRKKERRVFMNNPELAKEASSYQTLLGAFAALKQEKIK
jgi:hypothetical protein